MICVWVLSANGSIQLKSRTTVFNFGSPNYGSLYAPHLGATVDRHTRSPASALPVTAQASWSLPRVA